MKPSHFEEDEGQHKIQRFQTLSSIAPTNNRSSGSIPYTLRPHLVGVCGCNSTRIFHLLICSTLILHLSTSCLTSNLIINLELQLKVSKGNKYNCTHLFCNYLLVTTVCTRCAPAETWCLSWQLDFYIHTMLQFLQEQCIPHLPEHMTLRWHHDECWCFNLQTSSVSSGLQNCWKHSFHEMYSLLPMNLSEEQHVAPALFSCVAQGVAL